MLILLTIRWSYMMLCSLAFEPSIWAHIRIPHPQQEIQIQYEYEKPQKKPDPKPEPKPEPTVNNYNIVNNNYGNQVNVIALLGGRKLMQSDNLSSHRDMISARTMKTNESAYSKNQPADGTVDRRRLSGFKTSFSVTYKTETTDTTAQTFTTKTSEFTTSTFQVNCQCPVGESDRYEIP